MASWEGAEVELYAQQISVVSLEYTKILPKNCGLQQVDCDHLLNIKGVTFQMGIFLSLFSAMNVYLVPFPFLTQLLKLLNQQCVFPPIGFLLYIFQLHLFLQVALCASCFVQGTQWHSFNMWSKQTKLGMGSLLF